ncbi:MAG: hypothetical protein HIU89_09130 [Proteobacteria bacterium]|nr:hypothetical protein [Pseudomonadota bacterium]
MSAKHPCGQSQAIASRTDQPIAKRGVSDFSSSPALFRVDNEASAEDLCGWAEDGPAKDRLIPLWPGAFVRDEDRPAAGLSSAGSVRPYVYGVEGKAACDLVVDAAMQPVFAGPVPAQPGITGPGPAA